MTKTIIGELRLPSYYAGSSVFAGYVEKEKDALHTRLALELLKEIKNSPHVVTYSERVYVDPEDFCNVLEVTATVVTVEENRVSPLPMSDLPMPVEHYTRHFCHRCDGFTRDRKTTGNCSVCGTERRKE